MPLNVLTYPPEARWIWLISILVEFLRKREKETASAEKKLQALERELEKRTSKVRNVTA